MGHIYDISPDNIIGIFEYFHMGDILTIPYISKHIKNVLCSRNPYWDSMISDICKPEGKHITYSKSPGMTYLLINAGFQKSACVSCQSMNWIHRHVFYDVPICPPCEAKNPSFNFGGLKSVCKKYYLDPDDIKNNENIVKIKIGVNYRVLDSHVLKESITFHPGSILHKKMELRNLKRELVSKKRIQKSNERHRIVIYEFERLTRINDIRVDTKLRTFCCAKTLVLENDLGDVIFSDCFRPIVRSVMDTDEVSHRLFEFVCMLTFMGKKSLLDIGYVPNDDAHLPGYLFTRARSTGIHFYEVVTRFSDARASLCQRLDMMKLHLCVKKINKEGRKKLSVLSCAEDGVEYDDQIF